MAKAGIKLDPGIVRRYHEIWVFRHLDIHTAVTGNVKTVIYKK